MSSKPLLLLLLAAACSDPATDKPDAGRPDARVVVDARVGPDAAAVACNDVTDSFPIATATHVPVGTAVAWNSNPPSNGPHWPQWAKWNRSYDPAMERGHWVHNLEHGGVVLLYNCPTPCPDEVAALEQLVANLPADPLCAAPVATRTLISADPLLPAGVQIAAAAWGFTYTASCVDPVSLGQFISDHYAMGPENFCNEGQVPP